MMGGERNLGQRGKERPRGGVMLRKQSNSSEREWPGNFASRLERMEGIEDNREWRIVLRDKYRKARNDCIRVAGRSESPENFLKQKF